MTGLSVRRLFCDSPECGRRTFAEQVEGLTVRYQRRSPLLQQRVEMAGVLLTGCGGARLLHILRVPLSRTSVLFHLMRLPLPPAAIPRVLGGDDFALYADVYGTLLVDAETRLPIDQQAGRTGRSRLRPVPRRTDHQNPPRLRRQGAPARRPGDPRATPRQHLRATSSGAHPCPAHRTGPPPLQA